VTAGRRIEVGGGGPVTAGRSIKCGSDGGTENRGLRWRTSDGRDREVRSAVKSASHRRTPTAVNGREGVVSVEADV